MPCHTLKNSLHASYLGIIPYVISTTSRIFSCPAVRWDQVCILDLVDLTTIYFLFTDLLAISTRFCGGRYRPGRHAKPALEVFAEPGEGMTKVAMIALLGGERNQPSLSDGTLRARPARKRFGFFTSCVDSAIRGNVRAPPPFYRFTIVITYRYLLLTRVSIHVNAAVCPTS